jgi:8-oxo-dGTP pyrophosphatase MutT (NUDIX family)
MKRDYETLKAKIPVNKAGGGLVYNKNGEVLFIFRNGKWDLPKGGTEKGEDIEGTSMQVEEETGVINSALYENFKNLPRFQAQRCLQTKITHWFEMQSDFEEPLRAT